MEDKRYSIQQCETTLFVRWLESTMTRSVKKLHSLWTMTMRVNVSGEWCLALKSDTESVDSRYHVTCWHLKKCSLNLAI